MSKEFTGSWVIVIILILICWPAALIYFFMKYEETPQYGTGYYGNQPYQQPYQQPPQQYQQGNTCRNCGAAYEPGAQYCPKCGNRL
ncbi:MAG TPA: zinc-ribbon domain-containing protein [Methanomassiliicoccales archaeon]|nr:zinc-ribbon domain-containing protein [Methanomassiliicoccales archaeon]